jgi:hypothetical protein
LIVTTWGAAPRSLPFHVDVRPTTGEYDVDEDSEGCGNQTVELVFHERKNSFCPAEALQTWVKTLVERYGDDEGIELFKRLDMRLFADAPHSTAKQRSKAKG